MARTNINLPDNIDRDMRHEAVELGIRYPGEFVQHLWETYKKYEEEITMNREELIQAVLENPHNAMGQLSCYGGHGAGHGQLQYHGKWEFIPNCATGRNFEPTDEFVKETIWNNRERLWKRYK